MELVSRFGGCSSDYLVLGAMSFTGLIETQRPHGFDLGSGALRQHMMLEADSDTQVLHTPRKTKRAYARASHRPQAYRPSLYLPLDGLWRALTRDE